MRRVIEMLSDHIWTLLWVMILLGVLVPSLAWIFVAAGITFAYVIWLLPRRSGPG